MDTLERTHVVTDPAILYFGTPVVLLSTVNPDGNPNVAPISSVFWLGHQAMLGINRRSQSWANLARTGEVAVALPSADQAGAVNRLALTTGRNPVSERQRRRGYIHVADKFGVSGLTPVPADLIAPPLVADCPVVMECTVDAMRPEEERMPAVEVSVRRVHAWPDILIPGRPNRIDPNRWRPLIMSFQHFYGLANGRLVPSRLATVDEELYRAPAPAVDSGGRRS
ncbi:MAG TPA: flavin reductase family protein [Streptosporangiaceae bacterium]|jgi:flavin reductase (DIM6/NTAB) family NADH-FMN oxidoreductase RutF|nr:flavin reductase family protein [Streptosporangiaceae bacterium]